MLYSACISTWQLLRFQHMDFSGQHQNKTHAAKELNQENSNPARGCSNKDEKRENILGTKLSHLVALFQLRKQEFLVPIKTYQLSNFMKLPQITQFFSQLSSVSFCPFLAKPGKTSY